MSVKVKLEGFEGLEKALEGLPRATSKNVVRRVLKKQAEPIAAAARDLVPVDKGHLKKSIAVSTKLAKSQRRAQKRANTESDVEVYVGPGSDPAAHLQEFGSSRHPAQPYLRPAWDANKRGVLDGLKDDLWTEVKKSADRLARKIAKAKAKGGS